MGNVDRVFVLPCFGRGGGSRGSRIGRRGGFTLCKNEGRHFVWSQVLMTRVVGRGGLDEGQGVVDSFNTRQSLFSN